MEILAYALQMYCILSMIFAFNNQTPKFRTSGLYFYVSRPPSFLQSRVLWNTQKQTVHTYLFNFNRLSKIVALIVLILYRSNLLIQAVQIPILIPFRTLSKLGSVDCDHLPTKELVREYYVLGGKVHYLEVSIARMYASGKPRASAAISSLGHVGVTASLTRPRAYITSLKCFMTVHQGDLCPTTK